jgi:hypothetical protein
MPLLVISIEMNLLGSYRRRAAGSRAGLCRPPSTVT